MHDANPFISAEARKSGCQWLLIAIVAITSVVCILAEYFHSAAEIRRLYMRDRLVMMDLKVSIPSYKVDYDRYPILGEIPTNRDLALRSRGPMLQVLNGKNIGGLNPKEIKFTDLPMAKDRTSGLWQDGEEWVLCDQWGEPFYIVLDTNGDGKIANPMLEAFPPGSNGSYGGQTRLPIELPASAIVYSSGPDRNPKTWKDNRYSWQSH